MSGVERSDGGDGDAKENGDVDKPVTAECTFSAFPSDEETEDDERAPISGKHRLGSAQGRRAGDYAKSEAVSKMAAGIEQSDSGSSGSSWVGVAQGKSISGDGDGDGDSGSSTSSEGDRHRPQAAEVVDNDGGGVEQQEGTGTKGESGWEKNNPDEEDVSSAIPVRNARLEGNAAAAVDMMKSDEACGDSGSGSGSGARARASRVSDTSGGQNEGKRAVDSRKGERRTKEIQGKGDRGGSEAGVVGSGDDERMPGTAGNLELEEETTSADYPDGSVASGDTEMEESEEEAPAVRGAGAGAAEGELLADSRDQNREGARTAATTASEGGRGKNKVRSFGRYLDDSEDENRTSAGGAGAGAGVRALGQAHSRSERAARPTDVEPHDGAEVKITEDPNASGAGASVTSSDIAAGSGQGPAPAGDDTGSDRAPCPMCNKLIPTEVLPIHVNRCLDQHQMAEEEEEKKEGRAKRQKKKARSLSGSAVTTLGFGGGGGPIDSGGRIKKHFTGEGGPPPTHSGDGAESKANEHSPVALKRKQRGDDTATGGAAAAVGGGGTLAVVRIGAGAGAGGGSSSAAARGKAGSSGKGKQQRRRETTGEKKKGKGKGKSLPSDAAGQGVKCPKKLRGGRTKGCGAMNEESAQRCCECSLRFWEEFSLNGELVKVRLGQEATWLEAPHLARPGEKKLQMGFVHSLDVLPGECEVMAFCTYKKYSGYLSPPIALKDLKLVPPTEQATAYQVASRGGSKVGSIMGPARPVGAVQGSSSSSSTQSYSAAGVATTTPENASMVTSDRTLQSWGRIKCEHVAAEVRVNHKNGKCIACHNERKRAETRKLSPFVDDDPIEEEAKKRKREDTTSRCETSGCRNGHFELGVCYDCFARHRERVARIATAAAKERKVPTPCRACEGLLEDSEHAKSLREANQMLSAKRTDFSVTGRCSICKGVGGRGPQDPLLLCDGMGCPNASHCLCLEPKLTQVPRGLWFCDQCVRNNNREETVQGCTACDSTADDGTILLCDGKDCDARYHCACLPVPLETPPEGYWYCPRCVHGRRSCVGGRLVGNGHFAGNGGGGGGGSGGPSTASDGSGSTASSSYSSGAARGGGMGEKRKRDSSHGGGGGGGGEGEGESSCKKRSGKEVPTSRRSSSNGAGKKCSSSSSSSSPSSSASGNPVSVSTTLDVCANRGCLQTRNKIAHKAASAQARAGVWREAGACAAVSGSGGRAGRGRLDWGAAVHGVAGRNLVEALAEREAEERRWQCESRWCQGGTGSYHKRCLEARRTCVSISREEKAGGTVAPPCSAVSFRGKEQASVDRKPRPSAVDGGGGSCGGVGGSGGSGGSDVHDCVESGKGSGSASGGGGKAPLAALAQKLEATGKGRGRENGNEDTPDVEDVESGSMVVTVVAAAATAAVVAGIQMVAVAGDSPAEAPPPLVAETPETALSSDASDTDIVVVPQLAAAAATTLRAGAAIGKKKESQKWKTDFLCPECHSVVATQEHADQAHRGILRYRVFEATLARCFMAEFGKARWAVEDDRNYLGIKGARTIRGTATNMYGSIYEGVVDFIFRTCHLKSRDCFLDVGSGIGQVVMQAAGWAGCKSLGVEVVKERHQAAERLLRKLQVEATGTVLYSKALAEVKLIEGDFVHKWDQLKECTVIYLNNERGWFKAADPDKAKDSYESKLVTLIQELDRSVTLVTMEKMDPSPQGWTHTEHTYGTHNSEERVATFRAGVVKIHFYKTNSGSWQCSFCSTYHAKAVRECSCMGRTGLRSRRRGSSGIHL